MMNLPANKRTLVVWWTISALLVVAALVFALR